MSILCHVLARGRGGYVLSSAVRCSCLRFAPQTEARVQVSKVFKNASAPDLVAPKQDIETLRILNAKGNDYRQSQVFVVQTGMVQDSQRKPHCGLSASAKLRSGLAHVRVPQLEPWPVASRDNSISKITKLMKNLYISVYPSN